MTVPSYAFLAFGGLVALLINVSSAPNWRRAVLLIANLVFIASFTHQPAQLVPFAGLLALGYASLKLAELYKRPALLAALLIAILFVFCSFKRYVFLPHEIWLPFGYFTIGMSYVLFRILHLIIDAFQDALPGRIGLVAYLNYTLNFASLVSGPIQFYRDYVRTESQNPLPLNRAAVAKALERVIAGFFKVSVLSPLLYYVHQRCVFALPLAHTPEQRVLFATGIVAIFPFYLYANFSGYMDVVIGVACFARLELPENFNRPFTSQGFIEFWNRWHITLSHWIKTYVYSPLVLSLMRRFQSPSVAPLLGVGAYFVAFFIIGVWHGRTSMFVFFGVLLGMGVSVNKLYQIVMIQRLGRARYGTICANPVYSALSRALTFFWFAFSALWFWSSWRQLAGFAAVLSPIGLLGTILAVLGAAALALWVLRNVEERLSSLATSGAELWRYFRVAWNTALVVMTLSVTVVLNAPAPQIVYKGF